MSEHWTDPIITEYPEFFPEKDDFMYSGPEHYAEYIKNICKNVKRLIPRASDIDELKSKVKKLIDEGKTSEAQLLKYSDRLHRPLVLSRLNYSNANGVLNHEYAPEGFIKFSFLQIKQKFNNACIYYNLDFIKYEDLSMHEQAVYDEEHYKKVQNDIANIISSLVRTCENLMREFELVPLTKNGN